MLRAYDALKRIYTDSGNSISNTDAADAAEEFFVQCHSFKDWLKKELPAGAEDVDKYINANEALALAADFCNSSKHAGLSKAPRSGKDIQKINTHMKIDLMPRGFVASSHLEIHAGGAAHDALELGTECVKAWDAYLKNEGIVFPEV